MTMLPGVITYVDTRVLDCGTVVEISEGDDSITEYQGGSIITQPPGR